MKILVIFLLLFSTSVSAGPVKNIGEKGEKSKVNRTIQIVINDNFFQPNSFNVKKNETIKFILKNKGELVHEFNIATKPMHLHHQNEMEFVFQTTMIFLYNNKMH